MGDYYCTHCGADLEDQYGFDPDEKRWTCEVCGQLLLNPDEDDSDNLYPDVVWYCDHCGACLNDQYGFSDWEDEWECTQCGHINPIDEDHIDGGDSEDEDDEDSDDEYIEEHYCTNCGAVLNQQDGYNPAEGHWRCTNCGTMLYSPQYVSASARFEGVGWLCDNCGAFLNKQPGFSDWEDEWECTECGYANPIDEYHIDNRDSDDDEEGDDDDYDDDENGDDGDEEDDDGIIDVDEEYHDSSTHSSPIVDSSVACQNYGSYGYVPKGNNEHLASEPSVSAGRESTHTKDSKWKWIRVALITVALLAVVLFGLHKYREGKAKIPFSPSYAVGKDIDRIVAELEKAGFKRIIRSKDNTGWLNDGCVIRITFDGEEDYKEGKYLEPDVRVVITYSSENRRQNHSIGML